MLKSGKEFAEVLILRCAKTGRVSRVHTIHECLTLLLRGFGRGENTSNRLRPSKTRTNFTPEEQWWKRGKEKGRTDLCGILYVYIRLEERVIETSAWFGWGELGKKKEKKSTLRKSVGRRGVSPAGVDVASYVEVYVASDSDRQRPQHVGQGEGSSRHVSAGASKAAEVIKASPGSLLNCLLRCLIKVVSGFLKDTFIRSPPTYCRIWNTKWITSGKIISPNKQILRP